MRHVLILALSGLGLCDRDETAVAYGAADRTWQLRDLDGAAFAAHATLRFPEPGQIAGDGPCNGYSGVTTVPYPWFDLGQVVATRRACPDAVEESRFLTALQAMTEIEISGPLLILRNAEGREMLFTATD